MSRQSVLIHEQKNVILASVARRGAAKKIPPSDVIESVGAFVQLGGGSVQQESSIARGVRAAKNAAAGASRERAARNRPAFLPPPRCWLYFRFLALIAPTAVVIVQAATVAAPVPAVPVSAAIACFPELVATVPSLAAVIAVPVYVMTQSGFLVSDIVAAIARLRGHRASEKQGCAERKS